MFTPVHKNQKAKFRQRGFYCKACDTVTMTYGDGPDLTSCDCGLPQEASPVKKWDNTVTLDVKVDSTPEQI